MRGLRPAESADLVVVAVATLIAICVALFADAGPLTVAALLPLVLILPGYALTAALFPPGAIGRDLRLALTVALSIGATALSGLFLQIVVDLSRGVVVASLAAVTLAATAVARRERETTQVAVALPSTLPVVHPVSVLCLLAAIALGGIAVAIASDGARNQLDDPHFSGLWLVPEDPAALGRAPVVVGVSNHERKSTDYRVRVSDGARTIGAWRFRLGAGDEWTKVLPAAELPSTGSLVASLNRDREPLRRVALKFEPEPGGGANG